MRTALAKSSMVIIIALCAAPMMLQSSMAKPAPTKPAPTKPTLSNVASLPAGWTATMPNNGMVLVQIAGSSDVVILGIIDANQPEQIATMLARQAMQGFTIESTSPAKALDNGMFLATSQLKFADGRKGLTISRAALRPDGKTAMAAIISANPNYMPGFQTRVTGTTDTLKALIAGAGLPTPK